MAAGLMTGAAAAYLLFCPDRARADAAAGLRLCAGLLIPALLPYFVLSGLVIRSGFGPGRGGVTVMERLFHQPAAAMTPWLLGVTGGYPLGAGAAADLRRAGRLTRRQAQSCLAFSACCGPAFLVGVAGPMLGGSAAGLVLYLVHIVSAALTGVILRPPKDGPTSRDAPAPPTTPPFPQAFVESVAAAASSLLTVCASVTCFTILGGAVQSLFSDSEPLRLLVSGLMELTNGCAAVARSGLSWQGKFTAVSAAAAWGGLSVAMQTAAVFRETDLRLGPYLRAKALHSLLAAALSVPAGLLLRPAVAVMAQEPVIVALSPWPWVLFSAAMVFLIFLQIPSGNSVKHGV